MTILVVGHTGYVGRSLIRWLSERGVATAGLSRGSLTNAELHGCVRQFTYEDLPTTDFARFLHASVTGVVLLNADTRKVISPFEVRDMIQANVSIPAEVALLAAQAGVRRLVFASTYSIRVGRAEYSPQSLYAASKKAAEDVLAFVAQTTQLSVNVIRLYDIYGPGQPHDRLIPYVTRQTKIGLPISMTSGEQEICPIFIDDVCSALCYCLKLESAGAGFEIYSAYGPDSLKVRELPWRLRHAVGANAPRVTFDKPNRPREALFFEPSHPLPVGWSPSIGIDEGLKRVWESTVK